MLRIPQRLYQGLFLFSRKSLTTHNRIPFLPFVSEERFGTEGIFYGVVFFQAVEYFPEPLDLPVVGIDREAGGFQIIRKFLADLRGDFGNRSDEGMFPAFPRQRIGDELDKLLIGGLVSQLFADGVRRSPVRMHFIFGPGFRQRQIHGLFREALDCIDLGQGDFLGLGFEDGCKIGGQFFGLVRIVRLQRKFFPGQSFPDRDPIVVRASRSFLSNGALMCFHADDLLSFAFFHACVPRFGTL